MNLKEHGHLHTGKVEGITWYPTTIIHMGREIRWGYFTNVFSPALQDAHTGHIWILPWTSLMDMADPFWSK